MKDFDVVLKLRVSAASEKQVADRIAALIRQIEAAEDECLSVIDAVVEVPLRIKRGQP